MAEPLDSNVIWNKCGSDAQVLLSENGVNGSIVGAVNYGAAKFDNGIEDANSANYVEFLGQTVTTAFCISGWIKANAFNWNNRYILWNFPNHSIEWQLFSGISYIARKEVGPGGCRYTFNIPFLASDLFHIILVFDPTRAPGNRIRVFKDGVEIPLNAVSTENTWSTTTLNLRIGSPVNTTNSIWDNLKVNNGASDAIINAIIANKENEGFPPAGGFRMLDGALKSPMLDGVMVA